MFREFEGLNTHFEPRDLSLYRKLLPEPLAMPSQPVVTIFVADYLQVVPWPIMTRYQEWSVLLKSEWKGEEGWYSVTMPVTKRVAMFGGRYLGIPKYIVDEITFVRSEKAYVATAKYKSAVQLTLEFHPSLTRPFTAWEKELNEISPVPSSTFTASRSPYAGGFFAVAIPGSSPLLWPSLLLDKLSAPSCSLTGQPFDAASFTLWYGLRFCSPFSGGYNASAQPVARLHGLPATRLPDHYRDRTFTG